ncbi:MAG: hypothetical protein GXW85_11890 [Clostridia bacterium]|nr:hypothetical protein [Clostridia bacterium]
MIFLKKVLAIVFFILFIFQAPAMAYDPVFVDGVSIQGFEVAGLNQREAEKLLEPYIEDILNQEIIIRSPDGKKIWLSTYKEMGLTIDLQKAIEEGLAQGNKGFILKRWWERLLIKKDGYNIPLKLEIRRDIAAKEIQRLTQELVIKPQDAKFKISAQNEVVIVPDVPGVDIDTEKMIKELEDKLSLQGPLSILAQTKVAQAKKTAEDLKKLKIEKLYGQFTTWFNPQKKNRTQNIIMAAQALNDYIVAPGEEFSFNQVVGPRTKEAGYNEAPIILNNQFVEGIGGGVCQVSSTLYNVLVRTKLVITERHPHSLPVQYVPKGMDAAVVYGLKDLKFVNNTKGHLLIKTYVGQGALTIKIFGRAEEEYNVEVVNIVEKTFIPKTIVKTTEELSPGQIVVEHHGAEGYIVRVERIIKDKNQRILVHEILSRDYYPPIDKVILIANDRKI